MRGSEYTEREEGKYWEGGEVREDDGEKEEGGDRADWGSKEDARLM